MENEDGRSPSGPGLRPFGAEPQDASQAEPLVPNAWETWLKGGQCVFCGGDEYFSCGSTSFTGEPSYSEYTCEACKSVRRKTDRGKESWERSGHPLSYGAAASETPNLSPQGHSHE